MDTLFNIEPTTPRWVELADLHGIEYDTQANGPSPFCRAMLIRDGICEYYTIGETKREAVVALIHRLRLEGWREVSI